MSNNVQRMKRGGRSGRVQRGLIMNLTQAQTSGEMRLLRHVYRQTGQAVTLLSILLRLSRSLISRELSRGCESLGLPPQNVSRSEEAFG